MSAAANGTGMETPRPATDRLPESAPGGPTSSNLTECSRNAPAGEQATNPPPPAVERGGVGGGGDAAADEDWRVPGWIAPGTSFIPRPHTPRELMHALWQTGGQPVLCARRMGCSPRVVLDHIHAQRRHWEETNYSRGELFELCAVVLRGAVQKKDRWAVTLVGGTEWGQQALAPLPEPEHQWREAPEVPPIQELIPQVLEGLLDERHSIFTRCAARAGGHPLADGADRVARPVDSGPAPAGDRAGGAGDHLRTVPSRAGD